jgi:hypothetical protein
MAGMDASVPYVVSDQAGINKWTMLVLRCIDRIIALVVRYLRLGQVSKDHTELFRSKAVMSCHSKVKMGPSYFSPECLHRKVRHA